MSAGSSIFCYDANGNMTQKIAGSTTSYTYDAENRMTAVSGAAAATFVYDGDGNRVKGVVGGVTTTYIGNYFEWTGSTTTMKKYYAAGQRIAMREGSTLTWLLGDHLGSATITATENGTLASEQKYTAWGQTRSGLVGTDRQYTGQISESQLGLYFYNARFYDPYLTRFLSADSIIPQPGNPMAWDRFSYSYNNPIVNNDPTGHFPDFVLDLAFIALDIYFIQTEGWTPNNAVALCADIALALVPGVTGAGPALQVASRGAKAAAVAYAQAAVHLPAWARFGQAGVKLIQAIDGTEGSGQDYGDISTNPRKSESANLDQIFIPDNKSRQIPQRGWSLESIKQVVANPAMTRSTLDNIHVYNRENGNPVTYYYRLDGHYVVIDNLTNQVVQVSDLSDIGWIDEMTNRPIQPIQSK